MTDDDTGILRSDMGELTDDELADMLEIMAGALPSERRRAVIEAIRRRLALANCHSTGRPN